MRGVTMKSGRVGHVGARINGAHGSMKAGATPLMAPHEGVQLVLPPHLRVGGPWCRGSTPCHGLMVASRGLDKPFSTWWAPISLPMGGGQTCGAHMAKGANSAKAGAGWWELVI